MRLTKYYVHAFWFFSLCTTPTHVHGFRKKLRSESNSRTSCSRVMTWVKWSRYWPGVAQKVGRGIALLFHDRDTRRGWVVNSTPRPHFTPGKDPLPILQEAGWTAGPVWTGENLVPTGIRSRTIQPVVSRCTDWAIGSWNTRNVKIS